MWSWSPMFFVFWRKTKTNNSSSGKRKRRNQTNENMLPQTSLIVTITLQAAASQLSRWAGRHWSVRLNRLFGPGLLFCSLIGWLSGFMCVCVFSQPAPAQTYPLIYNINIPPVTWSQCSSAREERNKQKREKKQRSRPAAWAREQIPKQSGTERRKKIKQRSNSCDCKARGDFYIYTQTIYICTTELTLVCWWASVFVCLLLVTI